MTRHQSENIIIDVRERDEFLAEHIEGAINIPLSDFASHGPAILRVLRDKPMTFMCRSGNRARMAVDALPRLAVGLRHQPVVYEGGMTAWAASGAPTLRFRTTHLPILRQTQLVAGLIVLVGSALALAVDPRWAFVSLFVGGGLSMAGATGYCGLGLLLAKAPWNRVSGEDVFAQPSPAASNSDK